MKLLPAAAVFVVAFFGFAFFFLDAPVIPDADSYFHLAVAREFATHGYPETLPWTRFSIHGDAFGDKEFLFHALLAPFARTDAATGGRLALALLNATFAATITYFATASLGWWSVVVPLWMYIAAPMMTFRLIRLRPELLALLLLLAFVRVASTKRYVWMGVLAAIFALSYTAFHVVIGLAILWWIRERDWKLPVVATAGVIAGLLAHPGFPDNLHVWWVQNVLYFLHKSRLDVGDEIAPMTIGFFLLANLGFWIGIGVLAYRAPRPAFRHAAITAVVFAVLAILMQRMAVYFVPFATLVFLERMPQRGARFALALLATAALSLPTTIPIVRDVLAGDAWEADYTAFGKAVPPDAKVAAHWGPTEFYTFFAPQGRYLNVLDPVFMEVKDARVYAAQKRVFDGDEPDLPYVVKRTLDSDYIAFPAKSPLFERVQFDPRIAPAYNGYTFLGRIVPSDDFVRDWSGPSFADGGDYVRTRECGSVTHEETLDAPAQRLYELASSGRAELRIDDRPPIRSKESRAILGKGTLFRVTLPAGTHRFVVTTCDGFYLLERD